MLLRLAKIVTWRLVGQTQEDVTILPGSFVQIKICSTSLTSGTVCCQSGEIQDKPKFDRTLIYITIRKQQLKCNTA